jgi:hypothetical protein
LQTHAPATHSWPVAHATQAPPFLPHSAFVAGSTHVSPLQQPAAQSAALQFPTHSWLVQTLPALHAAHVAPPLPHTALLVPGWHTPDASQQPFGQLAASHRHAPATHSWPSGHAAQTAPFAPHWARVGGFTQLVPSQQPPAQFDSPQYAAHA